MGERLNLAVFQNKIADSLSGTKFNEIYSDVLGNQLEKDTLTVLTLIETGERASTSDKLPLIAFAKITGSR